MNKLLICMAVACVTAVNAAAQSFSAATYNIRQLNAKDTAEGNGWERRLPVISSLIRFHDFDIFGAQEVFHSQLQGMLAALPGYDYVGVGRDDGAAGGEYSAIFYKRSRFRLLDSGHFWLSEDPSKPGKGWDAKYVRICTWGRFYDRQSRQRFWFFTTHTDHRGEQARRELPPDTGEDRRVVPAASGSSSRATSTWARRAGAMRSCATPASCPTPTTRPKSAMPKRAPKTGSTRHQDLPPHRLPLRNAGLPSAPLRNPDRHLPFGKPGRRGAEIPGPDSVGPLPRAGRTGIHEAVTFRLT